MSLKDVNLKISYDSDYDDILNDFYVPVLTNSVDYKRSVGFFSSSSLFIAAKGISNFILNKGHMQLICGAKLRKNDLKAIKNANSNPEKVIEESFINEIEDLEEGILKDHIKALGWMIANNTLEIKIALLLDEEGNLLSENQGILHQKVGILTDFEGNTISFSGSNNETAAAWKFNIEEFKVFRDWKSNENEYLKEDKKKFQTYWEGKANKMQIIDIPTAIKHKLIEIAPDNIENLKLTNKKIIEENKINLWDYQKEAIQKWINNDQKGIFEMATGTGKTFTALGCAQEMLNIYKKLFIVIACPSQHLVKQWQTQIDRFGLKYDNCIIADSSNRGWKDQLADSLIDLDLGYKNHIIVLTTHRSFSSPDFKLILESNKNNLDFLLIADEVHGLGAELTIESLSELYNLRLGLSATPERWFDSSGTELIKNYFKGTVYQFNLSKAINERNPATGETYLTPYRYKPLFVSLNEKELEDYIDYSKKLALHYYDNEKKDKSYDKLLFKRSKIIKNASSKYKVLERILKEIKTEIDGTIIYCSPEQINRVMELINEEKIKSHRFTMNEGTTTKKSLKGISEREDILKKFANGNYKVLVAMKCLDEGVDVPPARIGILMASSGNPREYIQRIGRLIRKYPNKKEAIIYDIIVKPSLERLPGKLREIEEKIFQKELKRCEEISKIAINSSEALSQIYSKK